MPPDSDERLRVYVLVSGQFSIVDGLTIARQTDSEADACPSNTREEGIWPISGRRSVGVLSKNILIWNSIANLVPDVSLMSHTMLCYL